MTFIHFMSHNYYFCKKLLHYGRKREERKINPETAEWRDSIANVFEYFSPDILGISYGSLRNYGLSNEKTFQNSKCIIRKGTLLSKSGNRGKK